MRRVITFLSLLSSPTIHSQLLVLCGGIATFIIVAGVGIWGIVGAWNVAVRLVFGN